MDDRNGADGDRMRALVKAEPGEGMSLTERPVPEPGPGELRLRVESVGIDGGAEALIYGWHEAKRWYEPHLPQPFGHEFAGVVDAVGDGVDPDRAGDRVAVEPVIGCGDCRCCRAGDARLRPDRRIVGLDPGLPGAFAEYAIVPAANAYCVGDGVDPDGAVFLELLGLGVHALEVSSVTAGDDVAVTGPGPVGIGTLVAAVAAGARVTVVGAPADADSRLPVAAKLGAAATATDPNAIPDRIDVVFECSGSPDALAAGTERVRRGGEIVQIGLFHGHESVAVDLTGLARAGVSIRPVYGRRDSTWRRAVALADRVDLSPAVGPAFDVAEHADAFAAADERQGIKVTLHP